MILTSNTKALIFLQVLGQKYITKKNADWVQDFRSFGTHNS